jgi:hypothetical protein
MVRTLAQPAAASLFACIELAVVIWLVAPAIALAQDFLRFTATTVATGLDGVSAATIGPDGNLYYAVIARPPSYGSDGRIFRQQLDPQTGLASGTPELLFDVTPTDENILGLEFDPDATPENLMLWASFNGGDGNVQYRGKLARVDVPAVGVGGLGVRQDYVVNLPVQNTNSRDHQVNQMDFGPDGRLYFNVGSQSFEGDLKEVPLSAATLVADVKDSSFLVGGGPIDVNTDTGYDPFAPGAKVKLFATGLRNSYDIAWHSNGFAYAPINGNDTGGQLIDDPETPANEAVAAPSSSMSEQLALVIEGGYYGHPNPSRGEYITHGGYTCNVGPCDPWQHDDYPFPTQPEPGWNPDHNFPLLTTITAASLSPNPVMEYTGGAGLKGWVLVGYTTARSDAPRIQAFQVDLDTGWFLATAPLEDPAGNLLDVGMPLDLVMGSAGRIYVASLDGSLIMLTPFVPGDYNENGAVDAADYTYWRDQLGQAISLPNSDPADNDGVVTQAEYEFWTSHFGTSIGAGNSARTVAVPEPSTLSLTILAFSAFVACRRNA